MGADASPVVDRFLSAVGERDFDAIGACFTDDALLRAVVPSGVREDVGPGPIADRYRRWLGAEGYFALTGSEATPFADVTRIRYVVEYDEPELGRTTFEQTAYAEIEDDRFVAVRLACSGERPAT